MLIRRNLHWLVLTMGTARTTWPQYSAEILAHSLAVKAHDKAGKPEAIFSRMRSSTTYASTWKAIAKRSRTYSLCALSSVDNDQEGHFLIQAFLLALGRSVRNRLKHRLTLSSPPIV
jgi:hypothetical protein